MRIGKWEIKVGEKKIVNQIVIIKELERFLTQEWRQAILESVKWPWWSVERFQVPSPIVRVDMTPVVSPVSKEEIKNNIYEVETRPAGLGITLSLIPEKSEVWRKILVDEFNCQGLVKVKSTIEDDQIGAEIMGLPYYEEIPRPLTGPYWVRSNLRSGEITKLEKYSLVPITEDGNKAYLLTLKMAEKLTPNELEDWSAPFVVKPLIGARMEGVELYLPPSLRRRFNGGSTRSRVERVISGSEEYILQKFIFPQKEEREGKRGWTIWRLYFGWQSQYRFIGGIWNWRPSLRIHGASDAIIGPIGN